jgi:methylthioribose-1-phosphate isomerase
MRSAAEDGWHAIRDMRTRGAPAIAIVAALALAVELQNNTTSEIAEEVKVFVCEKLRYLVTSRPTAVNLADAAGKLDKIVTNAASKEGSDGASVSKAYCDAAARMLIDDVSDNQAIGKHGAEWIMSNAGNGKDQVSVVTHCNTGYVDSSLDHCNVTETVQLARHCRIRHSPRLTAFELVHDKIPSTLVTDSMASALLRLRGPSENIAAIVVGADRVAANGDTANKIGTYQLAITAKHHGVKFLVAAPRTTIDLSTASGSDIVIEERPGKEMTFVKGPRFDGVDLDLSQVETVSIAANGIGVWNPSFDVTPAELIDGIITEVGVVEKGQDGKFDLTLAMEAHNEGIKPTTIGGL